MIKSRFFAPAAVGFPPGPGRVRPALAAALLGALAAPAFCEQPTSSRYPITDEQRQTADKYAQSGVALADLAPGAPERYTIKSGDTLWSISILYLKSPWRWPELWGMNRQQVSNPHLIYPGQVLYLVTDASGRARLQMAGADGKPPAGARTAADGAAGNAGAGAAAETAAPALPVVKLQPRVRDLGDVSSAPIPSIPNRLIEPFLSQPVVVGVQELAKYPRIVATPEDRVYLGRGDMAYARGIEDRSQTDFHVFRPAKALYDPDDKARKKPIAYEAQFLGSARVVRRGEISTLTILDSRLEIGVEDRLIPIEREPLINYSPHRPVRPVDGRLISVYGGVSTVGAESIVTLNRGAKDGLEIGTVLAVSRAGQTVRDRTAQHKEIVKLPDERIGQMFVFRVFDSISYALVMTATGPIKVGDRFSQPDFAPENASNGNFAPESGRLAAVH
jgi:nucleoid-associated protein YgaU